MRTRVVQLMFVLAVAMFVVTADLRARAAVQAPAAADVSTAEKEAAARATQERLCGLCHEASLVAGGFRTPAQWDEVLDLMASYGADMSQTQRGQIIGYLLKSYGKADANRATAQELAPVLDITQEKADELVKYRSEHGPFKTLDDLKTVPGIDAAKLETRKDRLIF